MVSNVLSENVECFCYLLSRLTWEQIQEAQFFSEKSSTLFLIQASRVVQQIFSRLPNEETKLEAAKAWAQWYEQFPEEIKKVVIDAISRAISQGNIENFKVLLDQFERHLVRIADSGQFFWSKIVFISSDTAFEIAQHMLQKLPMDQRQRALVELSNYSSVDLLSRLINKNSWDDNKSPKNEEFEVLKTRYSPGQQDSSLLNQVAGTVVSFFNGWF